MRSIKSVRASISIFLLLELILPTSVLANDFKIRVYDLDSGKGISSEIYLVRDEKPKLVAHSLYESDGVANLPGYNCELGDYFYAHPSDPSYFKQSRDRSCNPDPVSIAVRKLSVYTKIGELARKFELAGEYGKASQAYAELYWTNTAYVAYQKKSLDNVIKALNINSEGAVLFNTDTNLFILSEGLKSAIEDFQIDNGLRPDGIIGRETLRVLASGSVSDNIFLNDNWDNNIINLRDKARFSKQVKPSIPSEWQHGGPGVQVE